MDDQSVVPYFQGAYSYYQPQATWPVNMNTQIGDQLQVFDQNITASYNHSSHHETGMMTYPEQTSNLVLNSYPVYPAYDTGLAYPNYDSTGVFTNPYEIGALDPYQCKKILMIKCANSVLSPSFIQTSGYEASTLAGQPTWPSSGETTLPVTSYEDGAFLYPYQSANLFLDSTLTQNSNQGAFTFTEQLPNLNNALPFVDPYHNPVLIAAEGYFGQPSVNPAHNGGMAYLESAPSTQPHDPMSGMGHINLTPGLPMEGSSHPIPFDSGLIQAPVATNKPRIELID
ncbi:uncharacterized protein MELLADRAFT_85584 [Melampsora larici-populina 98AG31]|uniref:Uncharacterized protein n=1 Tax=Melampsora larici-populina (strain 98AG31 / pathotype 3-4-7) TaxID=747676 RepID=F4SD69_MELLP|nr:uncharacterized protein MELLADRAFT_85584 [Melampsora larici-populina 98AG31]EGF97402.1 hypothetical protein MELLADRAFT_85584 [Melampsora larici-populina 98AG31]